MTPLLSDLPRRAPRPYREREAYAVQCWRCHADIEIPAAVADKASGAAQCPKCGAPLTITWRWP